MKGLLHKKLGASSFKIGYSYKFRFSYNPDGQSGFSLSDKIIFNVFVTSNIMFIDCVYGQELNLSLFSSSEVETNVN